MKSLRFYKLCARVSSSLLAFGPKTQLTISRNFITKEFVLHSDYPEVEVPKSLLTPYILDKIKSFGSKECLEDGVTGETITFDQLLEMVPSVSNGLQSLGLSTNDVVSVVLPNCIQFPLVVLGASGAGCQVSPVNSAYTLQELHGLINMSNAKLVVTDKESYEKVSNATKDMDVKIVLVDAEPTGAQLQKQVMSLKDVINIGKGKDLRKESLQSSSDSIFLLPFSSGTTGKPKGVKLSHSGYLANIAQFGPLDVMDNVSRTVLIFPMYHAAGMKIWLESLLNGFKLVTLPSFNPDTYLSCLLRHQPEQLTLPPPLVLFLAKSDKAKPEHFKNLDKIVVGAAPVGEVLINDFLKKAPHAEFREAWGMTELSAVGTMTSKNIVHGSCGKLISNTKLKIVDLDNGQNKGPGKENTGEICVQGPQMMLGYLNNPEETAKTIQNGWLHTGDIGYYDDDGNIYICDRLKELIKVKGHQVAPAELEDLIRGIDEVTDVAVIGIPDQRQGEVPRAYVVKSDESLPASKIEDYIAERLSSFKHLKGGVAFVKEIPKSAAGKILRKDLKSKYLEEGI